MPKTHCLLALSKNLITHHVHSLAKNMLEIKKILHLLYLFGLLEAVVLQISSKIVCRNASSSVATRSTLVTLLPVLINLKII